MSLYESVFIARQDLSTAQAEALADNFSRIVAENGARITKTEHWGLRNIAYRINKNRKGHYVLLNIDGPYSAVAEMERHMKINEDVLRYMTLRVEKAEDGPSVMMQQRNERSSDRYRGGDSRRGDEGGYIGEEI
ncbi:MAG: 30S ribosomal protein S6 [Alphaproteobacteria bacterium]